jgi:glutaredoxin
VIVSASWCQPCRELEAGLDSANVPYQDVDFESPAGAGLVDTFGLTTVPTVFVKTGNRYALVPNPTVASIRAALARQQARECDAIGG